MVFVMMMDTLFPFSRPHLVGKGFVVVVVVSFCSVIRVPLLVLVVTRTMCWDYLLVLFFAYVFHVKTRRSVTFLCLLAALVVWFDTHLIYGMIV